MIKITSKQLPSATCIRQRGRLVFFLAVAAFGILQWTTLHSVEEEVFTTVHHSSKSDYLPSKKKKTQQKKQQKSCDWKKPPEDIIDIHGTWEWQFDHRWVWKQSSRNREDALPRLPLSQLLPRNTSLVLYGSSHIRELYFSLVRWEWFHRKPYSNTTNSTVIHSTEWNDMALPPNITFIPSGQHYRSKRCDPTRRGWIQGKLGIDLIACGLPGRQVLKSSSSSSSATVAYGFKTFLHTPDADAQFRDEFLKPLRVPHVVVTDVGIWGTRGARYGGTANVTLTPQQELDYYFNWLSTSFPQSIIVVVYEPDAERVPHVRVWDRLQDAVQQHADSWTILRKDVLLAQKPNAMPCGHGCAGPVLTAMTTQLLSWIQRWQGMMNCDED